MSGAMAERYSTSHSPFKFKDSQFLINPFSELTSYPLCSSQCLIPWFMHFLPELEIKDIHETLNDTEFC